MMNTTQPQTLDGNLMALGGQILFDEENTACAYRILAGEVLILRNGQMVDLVQAGELLDASLWDGVKAVAWTDCVLQTVENQPRVAFTFMHPEAISQHLSQSLTAVN